MKSTSKKTKSSLLLKEKKGRTQEWFEKPVNIIVTKKLSGFDSPEERQEVKVKGFYNDRRYPGVAYAEYKNRFVIFHKDSGWPLFYSVANEMTARKLVQAITQGAKAHGVSWDVPAENIQKNLSKYGSVVRNVKKSFSKRSRGKFDALQDDEE